jgi:hypothetical protein
MAYLAEVVFVETPIFTRRVQEYMDDEEYAEMQAFLSHRPDAGNVIRDRAGCANCAGRVVGVGNAAG